MTCRTRPGPTQADRTRASERAATHAWLIPVLASLADPGTTPGSFPGTKPVAETSLQVGLPRGLTPKLDRRETQEVAPAHPPPLRVVVQVRFVGCWCRLGGVRVRRRGTGRWTGSAARSHKGWWNRSCGWS